MWLMDKLFLEGRGYQFWSGIGISVFVPLSIYRAHLCHKPRCFRWGHPDPEHGHPACRKHHSRPPGGHK